MSADFTYREYWETVDGIIDDIKSEIQSGDITEGYEVSDRINEMVDSNQWIIYTGRNIHCLLYSENEDAYFEQMGKLEAESFGDAVQRMAYYAMVADVESRIGDAEDFISDNAPCDNCHAKAKADDSDYCEECEAELNNEVDDE